MLVSILAFLAMLFAAAFHAIVHPGLPLAFVLAAIIAAFGFYGYTRFGHGDARGIAVVLVALFIATLYVSYAFSSPKITRATHKASRTIAHSHRSANRN